MNGLCFLVALIFFLYLLDSTKEHYTDSPVVMNNNAFHTETNEQFPGQLEGQYTHAVIDKQQNEINRLRTQIKKLAEIIDSGDDTTTNRYFYRRKLSNSLYKVAPTISAGDDYLSLYDDDFSTKTLSNIKFLSQTRASKFYDTEVHFPTELCGNFCTTTDNNAVQNEQVDLVRPISQTSYLAQTK